MENSTIDPRHVMENSTAASVDCHVMENSTAAWLRLSSLTDIVWRSRVCGVLTDLLFLLYITVQFIVFHLMKYPYTAKKYSVNLQQKPLSNFSALHCQFTWEIHCFFHVISQVFLQCTPALIGWFPGDLTQTFSYTLLYFRPPSSPALWKPWMEHRTTPW